MSRAKISRPVRSLHTRFEVNTAAINDVLRTAKIGRLAIWDFDLYFDAVQDMVFSDKNKQVGGWSSFYERGVHIVAGDLGDMVYLGSPGEIQSFENVILHEIGHFLHRHQVGNRSYTDTAPLERERIAQDFSDNLRGSIGQLVDYEFKP